jgi:FdhD protein
MTTSVQTVDILRVGPDARAPGQDVAAAEEPLEIRLGARPFVVIMRTPGADRELAAGFLLSERIVRDPSEIASMRYCGDLPDGEVDPDAIAVPVEAAEGGDPAAGNVLGVWLRGAAAERAAARVAERRHVTANSSCGVCGRRSIDDLMEGVVPVISAVRVPRATIAALPDRLRAAQAVFDLTGGLHAAGLFGLEADLMGVAEDVGRHNAVDKVLGAELLGGRLPLADRILFVSGRTSFEIVQKAVVGGVPVVASVSAPSSLAIALARDAGVTLLGFVRDGSFNVYTGAERIAL